MADQKRTTQGPTDDLDAKSEEMPVPKTEMKSPIIDFLKKDMATFKAKILKGTAANEDGEEKEKPFEAQLSPSQKKLYRRKLNIFKLVAQTIEGEKMDTSKIHVQKLEGDAVGKTEDETITVDPVIFKDEMLCAETLLHEATHTSGIENEGLTALEVKRKMKSGKITEGEVTYAQEIKNVKKIINVVTFEETKKMYVSGEFTKLLKTFKGKYPEKIPRTTNNEIEKIFFNAFPELKKKTQAVNDNKEWQEAA